MAGTPFGRPHEDSPDRDRHGMGGHGHRARRLRRHGADGAPPRAWQRSFRCQSGIGRSAWRADSAMARYRRFVALHEAFSQPPQVNERRLWLGGAGVSAAAAGMAFAGVLVLRGLFGFDVPAFGGHQGRAVPVATTYALCAAAAGLQATALLNVLATVAVRPVRAFGWIGALAVLLLTLLPLTVRAPLDDALATAALNLVTGCLITGSVAAAGAWSMSWPQPPRVPY
ncbi:hypothetical protein Acsp04_34420 [Actinomadura sp. NBRC 104425]|uniref:DUF6069 family protein n=1 Tax=Actinomadura sp. NBRC 104425 TaxID=3032204 RepID=UPI00249FF8AD|nr:DUF6069 family protein [Actinomadura sp. NBRC 104425]GLZ13207.1 hypothetical protein Acsp04_34420 [Actinomadura sp. NBRC 104425]